MLKENLPADIANVAENFATDCTNYTEKYKSNFADCKEKKSTVCDLQRDYFRQSPNSPFRGLGGCRHLHYHFPFLVLHRLHA